MTLCCNYFSDPTYSNELLQAAQSLFEFANNNRGLYTDDIGDAGGFYAYVKQIVQFILVGHLYIITIVKIKMQMQSMFTIVFDSN